MNNETRKDIHNSELPLVCRSCEARHKGICGALSPDQLITLSKTARRNSYTQEEVLAAEGEESSEYGAILSGVVKMTKLLSDGRQQIVGLKFAPDFLGRPFQTDNAVTVEAATNLRVCSFPRSALESMIQEAPELEHRLHEQALRELDEARDWMMTLGRKSASEKVASFLHMIAVHYDPEADDGDEPITFDLPLKRADIADFLGLTIETVSRQMTRLRKAGVISIENNRTVTVIDTGALLNACEVGD